MIKSSGKSKLPSYTIFIMVFWTIFYLTNLYPNNQALAQEINQENIRIPLKIADQTLLLNGHLVRPLLVENNKRVVIIIHGILLDNKAPIIEDLQNQLADQNLVSLAINLSLNISNRRGRFPCNLLQAHRYLDAFEDIKAWIDWLRENGTEEIILLGHGRGGNQVAWYAAERDDPAISKLILLSPLNWDWKTVQNIYRKYHNADLQQTLRTAQNEINTDSEGILKGVGFLYCKKTNVRAETFISYYSNDQRRNTPDLFREILIKTLVIGGSEDKIVANLANVMRSAIKQYNNVKFAHIEGANHFYVDGKTKEVAKVIRNYIENY